MCGLVGVIDYSSTKFTFNSKEEFFSMLLINSLRGAHSTGVLGVRKDQKAEFFKAVGNPWDLWQYKEYDTFADRIYQKYTAVLGHGRFSTRGAITARNAHPHKRSHIHLIHNGTISNFDVLKKEYENTTFEVDSDLCANMLAVEGTADTVKELIGSFAFIWYDSELDVIKAIRNDDRPLWLFHRKMKEQYLLASDPAIFDYMKQKYNMIGEAAYLAPGALYTFNFNNDKFEKEQLKLHSYTTHYYNQNASIYNADEWDSASRDNTMFEGDEDVCQVPWMKPAQSHGVMSSLQPKPVPAYMLSGPQSKQKTTGVSTGAYSIDQTKWAKGDKVNFIPNGAVDKPDKATGEIYYVIKGILTSSSKVEVTGIYQGNIMDIYDRGILTGVIENIVVLDNDPKFSARLLVKDIASHQLVIPAPKEDEKDVDKNFLLMGDDVKIARHRFEELARARCGTCHGAVNTIDSQESLVIDDKLYCKECVLKGQYPQNG